MSSHWGSSHFYGWTSTIFDTNQKSLVIPHYIPIVDVSMLCWFKFNETSYGYGSKPINNIFRGLFTSINPSYFDVNRRGLSGFDPSSYDLPTWEKQLIQYQVIFAKGARQSLRRIPRLSRERLCPNASLSCSVVQTAVPQRNGPTVRPPQSITWTVAWTKWLN